MNIPFIDWLQKNSWALIIASVTLVGNYYITDYRLTSIEQRQDRQGTAISTLQTQQNLQASQYAALGAKIDGIKDNVDYIRDRIDRATQ